MRARDGFTHLISSLRREERQQVYGDPERDSCVRDRNVGVVRRCLVHGEQLRGLRRSRPL